jgi:hypothetical protein
VYVVVSKRNYKGQILESIDPKDISDPELYPRQHLFFESKNGEVIAITLDFTATKADEY